MAININKVILQGRLGVDPEIRRMNDGKPVASLRLATSEFWRDKQSGDRRENTQWHDVVIFNEHLCSYVEKYGKKGREVYVEGQLQTRKWQDQEGRERYKTEVVLQRYSGVVQFGPAPGGDRPDDQEQSGNDDYDRRYDDEIPF
ncbi:single-stranded DNA-binding protein (plasmid) [Agrobacterium leguminum]|uniref:single-stranded DNA-binding protein n=1 Tax=Agrobacterium leguminum TaxID=2792015 RepID=UPI0030D3482C